MTDAGGRVAICADVGSTFTKVAAVDLGGGGLLGTAEHRTTTETDVLHGLDRAIAQVTSRLGSAADTSTVLVCSSAGGGLRLAVVGYEPLVTAEAGHRVGLSAGAKVVHVAGGRLDRAGLAALREDRPDVVLLVGGTDGGEAGVLRHNAARLAGARLAARRARIPIVVAGNLDARDEVTAVLRDSGAPVVPTENVLPRIGELNPAPARAAIREVFLRHVIGGKGLSRGPRFASLVRGATPDVVLTAVELLAADLGSDLAVVDIGGATTDVYSVLSPDPDAPAPGDVAGTLWHSRTVEGDLGMRWSAPGVVAAAAKERLLAAADAQALAAPAAALAANPAWVPGARSGAGTDLSNSGTDLPGAGPGTDTELRLARLAATVALRRHARADTSAAGSTARKDLRAVRLMVGSGGVLRHAGAEAAQEVLGAALTDHAGGWLLPREARVVVDRDYVLAPAGLLAAEHPEAALALLRGLVVGAHGRG